MKNYFKAQYELGKLYFDGEIVDKNYEASVEWLLKAATQNDLSAQYLLGLVYGLEKSIVQNNIDSFAWLSIASINGHEEAPAIREQVKQKLTPENLSLAKKRFDELFSTTRK